MKKKNIVIVTDRGVFEKNFNFPIREFVIKDNKVIICANYYKNPFKNRNVFCLNEKAEILWQIQDPDCYASDGRETIFPFIGVHLKEDKLIATAMSSFNYSYEVDSNSGKLINCLGWSK